METSLSRDQFALLFAQNHHRIFRFIRTLVPQRADAEDVFQEACVVLWREVEKFRPGTDFVPWALAVAFNQVRSYRHRARRNRLLFDEALLAELAAEEGRLAGELDDRRDALERCLTKLAPRDVELVSTYYESQTTAKAVAEQLNRPVNTVYKALQRIRRSLYECIERRLAAAARS